MDNLSIDFEFDTEFANKMAKLESYNKHHYRPNSYFHKWWARRCGTTFRLLLKHLVEDPPDRDYYAPGGLEGKVVLDPMMGGGTTLHEAIRLGANVIGMDVDPIPVLQAKATLSEIDLEILETSFSSFFQLLTKHVGSYFTAICPTCDSQQPLRYMLYGVKLSCDCGSTIFVDSLVLRKEKDGSAIRLCPRCRSVVIGNDDCSCRNDIGQDQIRVRGARSCLHCGGGFIDDRSIPFYARYVPLVTVGDCAAHGSFYSPVTEVDLAMIQKANERREDMIFSSTMKIEPGPKSGDLVRRGIHQYTDLFSSRQLIYLRSAIDMIREMQPLSGLVLSLLVSTSLEFNSMLCGYKGAAKRRPGAIRHAFSHHAYSFPYTALENNPIFPGRSSGTLMNLFHNRVRRARKWALKPKERLLDRDNQKYVEIDGEVDFGTEVNQVEDLSHGTRRFFLCQQSAAVMPIPNNTVDFVVTDPPYYDSVQYSDLAAFFRVWLEQLLPDGCQGTVRWRYDTSTSAVATTLKLGEESTADQYVKVMADVFSECRRVLRKDNGRLIFSFHHWRSSGWSALTQALKRAGFILIARYVVHSENPISVHIANMQSLTDDAILVLAPVEQTTKRDWPRLSAIDLTDSSQFCYDCATLVGWMLNSELSDDDIRYQWEMIFR